MLWGNMFELIIGFIIGTVWYKCEGRKKDYYGEDWLELKEMLLKEAKEQEDREEKERKLGWEGLCSFYIYKNNNKEQKLFLLFFALLYLYIPHIITTKLKPKPV